LRLEATDASGIDYLLKAYGGMGSFNDLVLGQRSDRGVFAWKANATELNERLDSLRKEAFALATAVQRSHDASGARRSFETGPAAIY
jgi:hypothetical protein